NKTKKYTYILFSVTFKLREIKDRREYGCKKSLSHKCLGLNKKYIEVDHLEITNNVFQVELSTKVRTVACPKCKHKTRHIHGYRNQCIQGSSIEEKPVVLH